MDGPKDHHTKWSKSETERQISYDIAYMWNLKRKWYKWTYLQNRSRLTDLEKELMVTWVGGGKVGGVWGWHVHTAIYKIDNQQGPTVIAQETLLNILY